MIRSLYFFFFFFSSRRRHTRCSRDWSSDVCSSDLHLPEKREGRPVLEAELRQVYRFVLDVELAIRAEDVFLLSGYHEARTRRSCRRGNPDPRLRAPAVRDRSRGASSRARAAVWVPST